MLNTMIPRLLAASVFITIISCRQTNNNSFVSIAQTATSVNNVPIINEQGTSILTRFNPPPGFVRIAVNEHSFAHYLRHLPLKPAGSKVKYYNGMEKGDYAYIAVVNMNISPKDLQQCADAVMRLRGEYFYAQKEYDSISFTLTNGFKACYTEWMKGNRIIVNGNTTRWQKAAEPSNTYKDFRSYMDLVFTYAGTLSLSKTLYSKVFRKLQLEMCLLKAVRPAMR